MHSRTSRKNGSCSNQRSFHQLLNVVGKKGLKWQAIVRKKIPRWSHGVKEAIRAKIDVFQALLKDISSSDLQSRYQGWQYGTVRLFCDSTVRWYAV